MIARGPSTGLPVLAATTSPPVAADLADLVNVVVAYQMDDVAAAQRLAEVTGGPVPAPGSGRPGAGRPSPGARPARAPAGVAEKSALRHGEFLLAVKNPRRLVPRGLLVRARIPQTARDAGPAAARRQAWEGR